ncbi:MAG: TetR/AcrR family transcriptional regulator, partial [Roseovarius sp.]
YWYFKSRKHLLEALLEDWEARNTRTIAAQCALPASGITEAVCHFFRCFLDPGLFDQGLDFAVREWARRDKFIRKRIDAADKERLAAVAEMFARHGYSEYEADVRGRILYFMQLGYHALEVREPMEERTKRLWGYVKGFTGQEPDAEVVARFAELAMGRDWPEQS